MLGLFYFCWLAGLQPIEREREREERKREEREREEREREKIGLPPRWNSPSAPPPTLPFLPSPCVRCRRVWWGSRLCHWVGCQFALPRVCV